MSNSLAVATVTASIQNVLQSAFNTNLPDRLDGSSVTTVRPGGTGITTRGANLFLYQASTNFALRNQALPSRNSDGASVKPPQAALDLHYLISFYGDDKTWEPQRFLAVAVRTLNAIPVLSKKIVSATVQVVGQPGGGFEFLAPSDLSDGPELVRLTPLAISLEELSKLWSILLQEKYVLSVLYVASVVLIDSPESAVSALPVLQTNLAINLISPLAVTQVIATDTTLFGAIVAGAQVAVLGSGLNAANLSILIDGVRQTVTFVVQLEGRIEFVLPSTLRAGPRSLRVATFVGSSVLPTNESNMVVFLLRPTIAGPIGKTVAVSSPPTSPPSSLFDGTLSVPVNPVAGKSQRISLLLNRKDPPAGQPASGTVLTLHPAPPEDTSTTSLLVFPFTRLPAGLYAARLRIDDADSPPTIVFGSPPASPPVGSIGPEVVIP